jgi:hypothetical protein
LEEINYVSRSNIRADLKRDRDPIDQKRIYHQKFRDEVEKMERTLNSGSPSKIVLSSQIKYENRKSDHGKERYYEPIRPTSSNIRSTNESKSSNYNISRSEESDTNLKYLPRIPSYNYSSNLEPSYEQKINVIDSPRPKERLLTPTKYRKGPKKAPIEPIKTDNQPELHPSPKETSPLLPSNSLPKLSFSDIAYQPPPSNTSTPKTVVLQTPIQKTEIRPQKAPSLPSKSIPTPKPSNSDAFSFYQSKFSQGMFSKYP